MDLETVRFGQHAYEAILRGNDLAYSVTSPKRWLTEPALLDQKVHRKLPLTRRDVLTGLMAYALFAAAETGAWTVPDTPEDADVRVAHPVWPLDVKQGADRALGEIVWMAVNMASAGDWGVTTADLLCSWTNPSDSDEVRPLKKFKTDTIEPIAAAVELLPNTGNERRTCLVVDVGAGTTDIGIFHQLSPDRTTAVGDRIIPAGPAASVFKAGDEIDRMLISLLRNKSPHIFETNQARIKSEIRFQKESLFKSGRLKLAGLEVSMADFERLTEVKAMSAEIRQGVERCITDAFTKLKSFISTSGLDFEITVVMAGGGADIKFLRESIGKPLVVSGSEFTFSFFKPDQPKTNLHGAGHERMAVGLGAAREDYENVVHEHAKLLSITGLGGPKQRVRDW
jgi:molecular chaperone HscA